MGSQIPFTVSLLNPGNGTQVMKSRRGEAKCWRRQQQEGEKDEAKQDEEEQIYRRLSPVELCVHEADGNVTNADEVFPLISCFRRALWKRYPYCLFQVKSCILFFVGGVNPSPSLPVPCIFLHHATACMHALATSINFSLA